MSFSIIRYILRSFLFISLLVLEDSYASLAQENLTKVNIHIPGVTTNTMPFVIASKEGYYTSEGLNARTIVARTDIGLQGLLGGNFDFSQIIGATITAALAGAPLKVLMIFDYKSLFWLYSTPDIQKVTDLRRRRVAISAFGSGTELALRYILEKNALSAKEVVLIPMATSLRVQALQSRSVDAAVLSAPSIPTAKALGFRELIFFGDYIETVRGGVTTTEAYLKQHPDLAGRFIRATLKGLNFYNRNAPASVKMLASWLKVDEKIAQELYELEKGSYTDSGYRDESFQKKVIEQFGRSQALKEQPRPERIFDFRIVQQIAKELSGS